MPTFRCRAPRRRSRRPLQASSRAAAARRRAGACSRRLRHAPGSGSESVPSRGPERPPMPDLEGSVPERMPPTTSSGSRIRGRRLPAARARSRRRSRGGCRCELLLWAGRRCQPRDPQPAPVGVKSRPAPPVMVRTDAMRTAVSGGERISRLSSTASCRTPTRRASTFSASSRGAPRAGCRTPSPTPRAGSGA